MKTHITLASRDNGENYEVSCGTHRVTNQTPGIANLWSDIRQVVGEWWNEPTDDDTPEPEDAVRRFTLNKGFLVNPLRTSVILTDVLENKKVSVYSGEGDPEGHLLPDCIATMVSERIDPSLKGEYLYEEGVYRVNPDYVRPPEYRLLPE